MSNNSRLQICNDRLAELLTAAPWLAGWEVMIEDKGDVATRFKAVMTKASCGVIIRSTEFELVDTKKIALIGRALFVISFFENAIINRGVAGTGKTALRQAENAAAMLQGEWCGVGTKAHGARFMLDAPAIAPDLEVEGLTAYNVFFQANISLGLE
jgi:hypothetical protein